MVGVIAISLILIHRIDLVFWILLPLVVYLILFWIKVHRNNRAQKMDNLSENEAN